MKTEVEELHSAAESRHQKSICDVAAYVVAERARVRVMVRRMGSALMHSLLIVRDFVKYENAFTLDAMKDRQRRHLQKSDKHIPAQNTDIPESQVCEAVIASAKKTNEGYTNVAKSSTKSYATETLLLYILVTLILELVTFISTTTIVTFVGWCRHK